MNSNIKNPERKRATVFFCSILCCVLLCAQQQFVRFQPFWGNEDIRCVARSSDYLWLGTSNGVCIANNGNWTELSDIFPNSVLGDHFYSVSNMRNILPYDHKALFASDLITSCYDVLADTISMPLSFHNTKIIADAMCGYDNIAYIYAQNLHSLFSYNFDDGQLGVVKAFKPLEYNFRKMVMVPDGNHILLIDKSGTLYIYNLTTGHITDIPNIPYNAQVSVALFDSLGNLWIGADKGSVFQCKLNIYSKQIESVKCFSIPLAEGEQFTDIIDTELFICLATGNSGISFVNRSSETVFNMDVKEIHNVSKLVSLGLGYFFGIKEHFGAVSMRFSFVGTLSSSSWNDSYSLSGNSIIFLEEESCGNIIIGTKQGIDRFDANTLSTSSVTKADYSDLSSMVSLDNRYYLAVSQTKGLVTIDKTNGKTKRFQSPSLPNNLNSESLPRVLLVKSRDGLIYILNYGGVNFVYDRETGTAIRFSFDFSENGEFVEPIEIDNPDFAYFHSKYSIFELDKAEMQTRRLDKFDNIITNAVSLSDSVIIYSDGTNIFEYNCYDHTSSLFYSLHEMENKTVFVVGMMLDKSGKELWLTTSQSSIFRLNLISRQLTVFPSELYEKNHFLRYPLKMGSNGFLYFPGASGVLVVNPFGYKPSDYDSLQVSVNSFSCDDHVIYLKSGRKRTLTLPSSYKMVLCNLRVSNSDPLTSVHLHVVIKRDLFTVRDFYTSSLNLQMGNMSPGKYSLYASVLGTHGWGEMTHLADIKLVRNPFLSVVAIHLYLLILFAIIVLLFVSIIQDVKRKHNATRPENKELHSMDMIKQMISQLKIPLSTAKDPLMEVMKSNVDNADSYLKLVNVYAGVNQANRIADYMLNIYFTDNNDNDITVQTLSLNEWLANLVNSFDFECRAKGVKLEFISNQKIQILNTDVKQLERAVSFLLFTSISNSQDNTTVTISINIVARSYVRISIADRSVVYPFSSNQISGSYEQDNQKTGNWRFSYVQSIVDKLQGRLITSKRSDGGMLYLLDIPFSAVKNGHDKTSVIVPDSITTPLIINTRKMSLLLVDDQRDVLDYIKSEIEDKLNKVYTADNGVDALVCMEQNRPDIVVSDILMPGMNGFEFCAAVKTNLKTSHIPFIAISSRTEAMYQTASYDQCPDDFIEKPFDVNDFYQTVRYHIGERIRVHEMYESGAISRLTPENTFSSLDKKFVSSLNEYIDNINKGAVADIKDMEKYMSLSEKDIRGKIKALADTTLEEYIQNIMNEKK